MYTFIKSYVQENYRWRELNVGGTDLKTLLDDYQDVYFIVTQDPDTTQVRYGLNDHKHLIEPSQWGLSLTTWLTSLNVDTLTDPVELYQMEENRSILMRSHTDLRLKVARGNIDYGIGRDIPYGLDTDFRITSPGVATTDRRHIDNLNENAVFALNGQIVQHSYAHGAIYLVGAIPRISAGDTYNLSVIDFSDVGGIEIAPFNPENVKVAPQNQSDTDNGEYRFSVEMDVDLSEYTPLLVLDGHLHLLDNTYKLAGANTLEVKVNMMNLIMKAINFPYHSLNYLSPANLRGGGLRTDYIDIPALMGEDHTFLILIKNKRIAIRREDLTPSTITGGYTHYRYPNGMVFFDDYTLAPYRCNGYNQHRVSIHTVPNMKKDLVAETIENGTTVIPTSSWNKPGKQRLYEAFILEVYVF